MNLIQKYNLSDPNAFFKTLLIRPYVNQVTTRQVSSVTLKGPDYESPGNFYPPLLHSALSDLLPFATLLMPLGVINCYGYASQLRRCLRTIL